MKILLVNPNRYQNPPVPPLGLEYLCGMLSGSGHSPFFLDLCFASQPHQTLKQTISDIQPDIIGVTIRQIDSALYQNNAFFLDEIKEYVAVCKSFHIPVILGGSGFSIMPKEILDFTGADFGIYGPGESALPHLIDRIENGGVPEKISNGFAALSEPVYSNQQDHVPDYALYIQKEGTIGFRTQIGCTEQCFFCTEGKMPVFFHDPLSVAAELSRLQNLGLHKFHLCDSEFNLNLEHCIHVCRAILTHSGPIDWSLYMKPEPVSPELFDLLHQTGASLVTLSLDSQKDNINEFRPIETFLKLANKYAIPVIIDLSVGHPYENLNQTKALLYFLDQQPVASVGVNAYYRIYPNTPLYHTIKANADLHPFLINGEAEPNFLRPVFFGYFRYDELQALLPNNKKFRIEGFEKSANYQRINKQNEL